MIKFSCLLVSYNQSSFIEYALDSVFNQDYTEYEIIIADDCSNDGTYQIIRRYIRSLTFAKRFMLANCYSNSANLGIARNIEKGLSMCSNNAIVMFSGDDISLPSRLSRVGNIFEDYPEVRAYSGNIQPIDIDNINITWKLNNFRKYGILTLENYLLDLSFLNQYSFNGCAAAYNLSCVPSLSNKGVNAEDIILLFYSFLKGNVYYDNKVVVKYRVQGNSLSVKNGFIDRLVLVNVWCSILMELSESKNIIFIYLSMLRLRRFMRFFMLPFLA